MAGRACNLREGAQHNTILLEMIRLESRHRPANVAGPDVRQVDECICEPTACQRAECDECCAELTTCVNHRDFRIACPQRILGLHSRNRMNGVCSSQRLCG